MSSKGFFHFVNKDDHASKKWNATWPVRQHMTQRSSNTTEHIPIWLLWILRSVILLWVWTWRWSKSTMRFSNWADSQLSPRSEGRTGRIWPQTLSMSQQHRERSARFRGKSPLLHLGSSLQQPGTSSSPDWRVNWRQAEEREATSALLSTSDGGECVRVCVQLTLPQSERSRPGRAKSVLWRCRVWGTGRSPPPSWNLSYPVCWPKRGRPPSEGPAMSPEDTHMTLSAQLMQKGNTENSPKLHLRHRSALSAEYLDTRRPADSGWSETSSFRHGYTSYDCVSFSVMQ